jgi:hypothetical protein
MTLLLEQLDSGVERIKESTFFLKYCESARLLKGIDL